MSVLFMLPGQGAQRAGLLHTLPSARQIDETLQQTSDLIGSDCLLLDTMPALESTYAVQLCLLIAGVAMARVFAANGIVPAMVAGLSIGAFPAAVIAGALDYSDAVRLVQRRAQLMEQTYPTGYGMAAVTGLDKFELEKIIDAVHSKVAPVYLANFNAAKQLVISGSNSALEKVMERALEAKATKAVRLAVNVPSHCPLFDEAAREMKKTLDGIALRRPSVAYFSASTARVLFDPQLIGDDLASNMARQVHWSETMRLAWERGARLAIEMPGGTVLSNLAATQWTDGISLACDTDRLDTLLELAAREQS